MRFKRRQKSVRAAMRKREAIQPRKLYRVEADTFPLVAGINGKAIMRALTGSTGVRERGENAKVKHTYLGGLTESASLMAKR